MTLRAKRCRPVSTRPLASSTSRKVLKKSRTRSSMAASYAQGFHGVCIHAAMTMIQTIVSGMNTFQPSRMIWS